VDKVGLRRGLTSKREGRKWTAPSKPTGLFKYTDLVTWSKRTRTDLLAKKRKPAIGTMP